MIKKKLTLLLIACTAVIITSSCSGVKNESEITTDVVINDAIDDNEVNNDEKEIIEKKNEENNEKVIKDGVPSPLSGIIAEKERVERRPVAVMFDNHPNARWQSGLSQAEIVYEFLVEAPYTRYMGIFLINEPELIGPVRSARPYFVSTLLEYDPLYVRCGGSEAAKEDVIKYNVADVDGLTSGAFFRYYKTGKKAPNNLYTSMEAIRQEQDRFGYRQDSSSKVLSFNSEDTDIEGITADYVIINYNKNNTTKYIYDNDKKAYKRYKDGKLHIDEFDETEIIAKNIIIQEATTKVIDNEGRLDIAVIGQGNGKYITNGKAINIKWSRDSIDNDTIYYDTDGNTLKLNPGVTWIQITTSNPDIEIK